MTPSRFDRANTADLARRFAFATVALAEGAGGAGARPVQLLAWAVNAPVDGRPAIVVDDAFAAALERNFAARTVEYPIDYNHASLLGFTDAPAAGWIQALTVVRPGQEAAGRPAGILLTPDWTPEGRRRITDREYRYMSAVLRRDWDTGAVLPELIGAALTNSPAIHGLQAVAASAQPGAGAKASPPPAPPVGFTTVTDGAGGIAHECACGWQALAVPLGNTRSGVLVTDRPRYDLECSAAEAAVNECARDHREACPKAGVCP
ncbi:MAG TPA: phage protease [Thermoanaerobaculaceae bacterium]|nr:phage protease [Thermoanaerobaculaceae bacterium]